MTGSTEGCNAVNRTNNEEGVDVDENDLPLSLRDVDQATILTVLDGLSASFRTKDVSEPAALMDAHADVAAERQYHAVVGRYLSRHASTLGVELVSARSHPRGALWRRVPIAAPVTEAASSLLSTGVGDLSRPVRPGHDRSLVYMQSAAFRGVKDLLESQPEIGGVYFRPLDRGVCMVDLHPDSPKPRIGIGSDPLLRVGTTAEQLQPSLPGRIDYLKAKRAQQSAPSLENKFEAQLIRDAQTNGLSLPTPFPASLRFVHSQWRVDNPWPGAAQRFTDLIAVDLVTGALVIVELKAQADPAAANQVRAYVAYFQRHAAALTPFFTRVARVMANLYSCGELAGIDLVPGHVTAMTAWPTTSGIAVSTVARDLPASLPTQRHNGHTSLTTPPNYGPQYSSDPSFRARMRFHQSWWRTVVLQVPCGTGPTRTSTTHYGNMLAADAAQRGANFLSHEAFAAASARLAQRTGAVEGFRLLHNLLSSQALAFNLFGPLVSYPALATRLFRALMPGELDTVLCMKLEYAPAPQSAYLGDRTAFDAFVRYRRHDGTNAFCGIEVKLADSFSQFPYDRPRYRVLSERMGSPWKQASWPELADGRWNQLWRDHLLVEALRTHPQAPHGIRGRLMLVLHPADEQALKTVERYADFLTIPADELQLLTLDRLIDTWVAVADSHEERNWLAALRRRYLNLTESESARRGSLGLAPVASGSNADG